MHPIPHSEKLIETKACKHCGAVFPITDKDLEFYEKVSPIFGDQKYLIPSPTLCPECRQQRRLSFRNERKLYKRKCDATGKDIVSLHSPDTTLKVYHQDFWWSDAWDPMEYGMDFDFEKGFFEQMSALMQQVPKLNLLVKLNENCEYVSSVGNSKNCYLVADSDFCEDSMYSSLMKKSKNVCDGLNIYMSEQIYNSINCTDSFYLMNCFECDSSSYLYGCSRCTGCSDCFESSNLANKKYVIRNEQKTESEWKEFMKNHPVSTLRDFGIARNRYVIQSENVSGNNIYQSNNVVNSYNIGVCEDIRYCTLLGWSKECSDVDSYGINLSRGYESIWVGADVDLVCFSDIITSSSQNIFYSQCISWSQSLFGCIGLRNKSYCILNKQYTREEYEVLVPKIIEHMKQTGEWGEFFPSSLSPFGYNETIAQEYFPLTKSGALEHGFRWSDYETPFPKVEKIIPASKLPTNITEIPDDILNWAIECEVTKKPFRIISQELEFYRTHHLPIPRTHPDVRHMYRMKLRNPRKLHERKCDCCGVDMFSTYTPERSETVYCEACYMKSIVQ